ncbi:MAG: DNA translocase FtsK [Chloroflexi bacterium]|nr:DNA translocase FtsK [Chloroflexota bacterium]
MKQRRPEAAPPIAASQQQIRINLPEERPAPKPAPKAETPPPKKPEQLPLSPAAAAAAASAHPPSIAGLPSAMIVAEGVLHASQPGVPWTLPPIDLLQGGTAARSSREEVLRNGQVIEETLAHFNIQASVVEASVGPVVTRYEIKPAAGVKVSRIEALADDLALALAARSLRVEAPVPGKSVVGIEIPNLAIGLVALRDVVETSTFRDGGSHLTAALGRDVAGSPIVTDIAKLPHLLVAGQTGSGKSVCLSSILCSILLSATPDEVRFLIGDLKRVDFQGFAGVPHLIVPVMTDHEKILNALYWVTGEMDRRYRLLARASARNIAQYNEGREGQDRIPYIVFFIDELADLMLQAPIQVEKQITRVAQLARATGIHLILGTQRPSVDVITGLIKANIPARIAFATASAVDSRTILDMTGAEKLLGRGDMLVLPPDLAKPVRAQGVYVSDNEIASIARHWRNQGGLDLHPEVVEGEDRKVRSRLDGGDEEIDDARYEEAVEIVRRAGQASVSMLQRKMTVGFARAGRLIDLMEQQGVIGPNLGPGKMREVYGASRRAAGDDDGGA